MFPFSILFVPTFAFLFLLFSIFFLTLKQIMTKTNFIPPPTLSFSRPSTIHGTPFHPAPFPPNASTSTNPLIHDDGLWQAPLCSSVYSCHAQQVMSNRYLFMVKIPNVHNIQGSIRHVQKGRIPF